jgi:Kef-type K+ transport system membrane component KefB
MPDAVPSVPAPGRTPAISVLGYSLMIGGCISLFLLIRMIGERLEAPARLENQSQQAGPTADNDYILLKVLIALAAVLVTGRLLARLFGHIGQPPVIGEVVAGILLGPSLLGKDVSALILPASVAPALGIIANLGVILYMFLVGLELNPGDLRSRAHATVAISHASIVFPFVLGGLLALGLYPILSHRQVSFTSFALFMGVALSITAFPVLARILLDRGLEKTDLGVLALGCAAIDDVTAWCLLAFVVGVVQSQLGGALLVAVLALAFIGVMFVVVRPLVGWLAQRCEQRPIGPNVIGWVLVAVLLSAVTTEVIGIHAIFGAFLLGAVIPHDSRLARELCGKLHDMVTILLLPAFFAYTGMRTQIGLVSGLSSWLLCGLIIVVATVGKFGGALVAARLSGLHWRMSASLGVLMNTRGLMELIVLNIGLDLGVISQTLFAMMVLMALATTLATTPILHLLNREPVASASLLPSPPYSEARGRG